MKPQVVKPRTEELARGGQRASEVKTGQRGRGSGPDGVERGGWGGARRGRALPHQGLFVCS